MSIPRSLHILVLAQPLEDAEIMCSAEGAPNSRLKGKAVAQITSFVRRALHHAVLAWLGIPHPHSRLISFAVHHCLTLITFLILTSTP
jgi:hypothetical protein